MTEVVATNEFTEWLDGISDKHAVAVAHYIGLLAEFGVNLDHPYSSKIEGAKLNLRELRVKSEAALRVFYIFDPRPAGRYPHRW